MTNSKLIRVIAPFLIAGLILGGCAASNSDETSVPNTGVTSIAGPDVEAEPSAELNDPTLMGFEQPMEERNPAQQFAAGFLVVPLIALQIVLLPFML